MKNKTQEFETFHEMLKEFRNRILNLSKKHKKINLKEDFTNYDVTFFKRNIAINIIRLTIPLKSITKFRKEINDIYEEFDTHISNIYQKCDIRTNGDNLQYKDEIFFYYKCKENEIEEIESLFKKYIENEQEDYIRLEVFLKKDDVTYEGIKGLFTKEKYEKFSKEIFEEYLERYNIDETYVFNIKIITIYL